MSEAPARKKQLLEEGEGCMLYHQNPGAISSGGFARVKRNLASHLETMRNREQGGRAAHELRVDRFKGKDGGTDPNVRAADKGGRL